MNRLVIALIILLIILHQDFWWRADHKILVWGFLPISLVYHIFISIAASLVWGMACRYCWPADAEIADQDAWVPPPSGRGGH